MATTAPTGSSSRQRKNRARPGRPSELDKVVHVVTREDGTRREITAIDRVYETFQLGGSIEDAASRIGVSRQTLYNWQRRAVQLQKALIAGATTLEKLTDEDREHLRFLDGVERGRADGKLLLLGLNDRLARGGIPITTVTTRVDAQGNVVERTTKIEETVPDGAAIRWRLERSFPREFGRRVEVTGADGGPLEVSSGDRAEQLAGMLRAFLDGRADAQREAAAKVRPGAITVGEVDG